MKGHGWLILSPVFLHSSPQQDLFVLPRVNRISFPNASAHCTHPRSVLFLAVLRSLRRQALLLVQLLGHGVQSDVRVRHSFLQELLLQCDFKYAKNLAAGGGRRHITLRMHQISHETHHIKPTALFHGVPVQSLHIFALLWMVVRIFKLRGTSYVYWFIHYINTTGLISTTITTTFTPNGITRPSLRQVLWL